MEYSDNFSDMQRDALERLRQMQERSKNAIEIPKEPPPVAESEPHMPPSPSDPLGNLLSGLGISGDRLLIIVMLILLYKNKADIKLLLALAYLLL